MYDLNVKAIGLFARCQSILLAPLNVIKGVILGNVLVAYGGNPFKLNPRICFIAVHVINFLTNVENLKFLKFIEKS